MSTEFAKQYGIYNMTVGESTISVTSSLGEYDIKYNLLNEPTLLKRYKIKLKITLLSKIQVMLFFC